MVRHIFLRFVLSMTLMSMAFTVRSPAAYAGLLTPIPLPFLYGINFGVSSDGGSSVSDPKYFVYDEDYTYSTLKDYAYFSKKGFNFVRLPVIWERIQSGLNAKYDVEELSRIDASVKYAESQGMYIAIDIHNFARYYEKPIVGANMLHSFRNLWGMLALRYKSHPRVLFDIMNEPHDVHEADLHSMLQTAIDAIREQGATNVILIEGNDWTGASTWVQANSKLSTLNDSARNLIFEPHQYLNPGFTGLTGDCLPPKVIVATLVGVTAWAKLNHTRLLLGEFGAGNNSACKASFTALMDHIHANKDVWVGWSWWDADPWNSVPLFELQPKTTQGGKLIDAAQMVWFNPYLKVR